MAIDSNTGGDVYEEMYFREKKKNSILTVVAAALLVVAIGSFVIGSSNDPAEVANGAQVGQGLNGGQRPEGGPGGFGGQRGGLAVDTFFATDGSVDAVAVSDFAARLPQGAGGEFLTRFEENIDAAVADGTITQDQASELVQALEAATEGDYES